MYTLLLFALVVGLVLAAPVWPHSRSWGYYPSGGLGIVVLLFLLFVLYSPRALG